MSIFKPLTLSTCGKDKFKDLVHSKWITESKSSKTLLWHHYLFYLSPIFIRVHQIEIRFPDSVKFSTAQHSEIDYGLWSPGFTTFFYITVVLISFFMTIHHCCSIQNIFVFFMSVSWYLFLANYSWMYYVHTTHESRHRLHCNITEHVIKSSTKSSRCILNDYENWRWTPLQSN